METKSFKIVFLSDTHRMKFDNLFVGEGDVLVHSGDEDLRYESHLITFADWLGSQKFKHKIFVPGNHDFFIQDNIVESYSILKSKGITMLIDEEITIGGFKFYGTPYVPTYGDWAFMEKEIFLSIRYNKIPNDTDILITHGPPQYTLDNTGGGNVGSNSLGRKVLEVKPIVHAFGHIHEAYGYRSNSDTLFVNAAMLSSFFDSQGRCPWTVTIENKKVVDIIQTVRV